MTIAHHSLIAHLAAVSGFLLQDSFTDIDNTLLPAHTPEIGGPWVEGVGTHQIFANKCRWLSGGNNVATVESGEVDIYMKSIQSHSVGLVVRYLDALNYTFGWYGSDLKIHIFEIIGGGFFDRGQNFAANTGDLETMVFGNSVKVRRAGVTVSYTSVLPTTGRTRIGFFDQSTSPGLDYIEGSISDGTEI